MGPRLLVRESTGWPDPLLRSLFCAEAPPDSWWCAGWDGDGGPLAAMLVAASGLASGASLDAGGMSTCMSAPSPVLGPWDALPVWMPEKVIRVDGGGRMAVATKALAPPAGGVSSLLSSSEQASSIGRSLEGAPPSLSEGGGVEGCDGCPPVAGVAATAGLLIATAYAE